MTYSITQYTREKARKHGVTVKPSTRKGKKIDVFKNGEYIVSVGALGYSDYPTFIKSDGKEYADKRRKAYRKRHKNDNGDAGFYAWHLLW